MRLLRSLCGLCASKICAAAAAATAAATLSVFKLPIREERALFEWNI